MFCAAILVHITRYLHRENEPLEILGIRPAPTHQHDTTSTENSTGELETEFEEMNKKGGYGQHLLKENVREEPGLVTGR